MILFLVRKGNIRVVCWAYDREEARRQAYDWIGADPDQYIVTPLSKYGDRVHLHITLQT